jgi:hypothetical protein
LPTSVSLPARQAFTVTAPAAAGNANAPAMIATTTVLHFPHMRRACGDDVIAVNVVSRARREKTPPLRGS